MGQAGRVSVAAEEIEAIAADLRSVVPEDWTGRAAEAYRRRAASTATGLSGIADRAHSAAALIHQHELEMAAMRAALATGGPVAV